MIRIARIQVSPPTPSDNEKGVSVEKNSGSLSLAVVNLEALFQDEFNVAASPEVLLSFLNPHRLAALPPEIACTLAACPLPFGDAESGINDAINGN